MVFDAIIQRTFGFVQARNCRAVWTDGRLYIAKSPTDVVSFESEAPVKHAGTYRVMIGDQALRMQLPGCGSCRARIEKSPLGKMTAAEIVAAVNRVEA